MASKADSNGMGDVYLGIVGNRPCYTVTLRGSLTDPDSNWRLWNADMKVYRDGAGKGEDEEVWASIDDEILAKMERRRKCIIWFSIAEHFRQDYLTDMGGREKTSEDVMRRMFEKVAPEGSTYTPLESLTRDKIDAPMRESMLKKRTEREAARSKNDKKS